jgi:hypothetical protein
MCSSSVKHHHSFCILHHFLGGTVVHDTRCVGTITTIDSTSQLRRLIPIIIPFIPRTNGVDIVCTHAPCDRHLIAVIAIDTSNHAPAHGPQSRDCDIARVHRVAVPATAVNFAKIVGVEVFDGDSSATVVLDDLVRGVEGSSSTDIRGAGGLLYGQGICLVLAKHDVWTGHGTTFTYVLPPDILDSAGAHAVHAFNLVLADDYVLESATTLDQEDCIRVTAFVVPGASHYFTVSLSLSKIYA